MKRFSRNILLAGSAVLGALTIVFGINAGQAYFAEVPLLRTAEGWAVLALACAAGAKILWGIARNPDGSRDLSAEEWDHVQALRASKGGSALGAGSPEIGFGRKEREVELERDPRSDVREP